MQAQVRISNTQTLISGFSTIQNIDSNIADKHKERYQCKLKLPTRLTPVSFIRKT
jgi:hypothetical protein